MKYSSSLFGSFPRIEDIASLSLATRLSKEILYKMSKVNHLYYRIFNIQKKSGGFRKIMQPSKKMKAVQGWILRNILDQIPITEFATGFCKGKNLSHNANPHCKNKYFLCLDIDDFFPSIKYKNVFMVFKKIGYSHYVSHLLSSFCTCEGILPQGAVTSPAISNIVCINLDNRIAGYVSKRGIVYTRYADDMTFSCLTPSKLVRAKPFFERIINEEGYEINVQKTHYMGPQRQRKITGLIVGNESIGIGKRKKRFLRTFIYRIITESLPSNEIIKLKGWLSFLQDVDPVGYQQLKAYSEYIANKFDRENLI